MAILAMGRSGIFFWLFIIHCGIMSRAMSIQCIDLLGKDSRGAPSESHSSKIISLNFPWSDFDPPLKMAFRDEKPISWNGQTFVFTPGLSETGLFFERHAAYLLKKGFRVVRLEPFNVGETLLAQGRPIYNLDLNIDALAQTEVIKSLNLDPGTVTLVGHSRGGATSIIIASLFQRGFFKDVYISNSYFRWLPDVIQDQWSGQMQLGMNFPTLLIPAYYSLFSQSMIALNRVVAQAIAAQGVNFSFGMVDFRSILATYFDERRKKNPTAKRIPFELDAAMAQYSSMEHSSVRESAVAVYRMGIQVKVGVAQKDPLVPRSVIKELSSALGISSVQEFQGGHMTPIEQFDKFMEWILSSDSASSKSTLDPNLD